MVYNLDRINDFFAEYTNACDFAVGAITLPFSPVHYAISDPKTLEFVLKTEFQSFEKGDYVQSRFREVLGHGIFNADGENWKIQRKTSSKIFNIKAFKEFVGDVFQRKLIKVNSILEKRVESGEPIDMHRLFHKFTMDGFAQIGYGGDLNTLDHDIPFTKSFDACQKIIEYRFISPFWKIEELLNLNAFRLQYHLSIMRKFADKIVSDRMEEATPLQSGRNDLLTLFKNHTNDDGSKFTKKQLMDIAISYVIAGRDGTAQALSWCIYELNKNPHVLTKLRAEIDEVVGKENFPTYEQVKGMKYANAVFNETLRIWPTVPKNIRIANRDVVLPCGTLVPKGDAVIWAPFSFGRNKRIWGPTALEFNPDRWIEAEKQPSNFEHCVFNAGPRICIGRALAELEGVFALVSLLRKFDFEVTNMDKVHYGVALTLPMKNGLICKITERKQ